MGSAGSDGPMAPPVPRPGDESAGEVATYANHHTDTAGALVGVAFVSGQVV